MGKGADSQTAKVKRRTGEGRRTYRQTDKHKNKQSNRQTKRPPDRQTAMKKNKQADRQTYIQIAHTHTRARKQPDSNESNQTDRLLDRQADTHRTKHKEAHRQVSLHGNN